MSQRSEKLRRRVDGLEQQVEALWTARVTDDHFAAALRSVQAQNAADEAKQRRDICDRARQAERAARTWKTMTYAALGAAIIVLIAAILAVQASGADAGPAAPPTTEMPAVQLIPEQEDYENEKIEAALLERAVKIEDVTVTHYCPCVACCGKDDGITASGRRAAPGISVAVDPDVIPLGSDVLVDYGDGEIHYYRADDTGSAVKGDHIDLCMDSHEAALEAGVKTATVWWIQ